MSTSSVALYIDAGSRADKMTASGAAHFLEVSRECESSMKNARGVRVVGIWW
jgi:hypothetical protein